MSSDQLGFDAAVVNHLAHTREQRDRRDRFAAAALTGLLANGRYFDRNLLFITESVLYADEMIRVLDAPRGG